MLKPLEPYILTFIPIFVAVDIIGILPMFISLVEGTSKKSRARAIVESVTTATVLSIIFMLVGKWIFRLIGISIPDFQIAGGALLFVISVRFLLPGMHKAVFFEGRHKDVGIFPLGTPLITGPAVLTTTIIMLDTFGIIPTFVSLVANMLIVWFVLSKADFFMKIMGPGGTRAFSKVMYILLAAIGVMMVRRGIEGILIK
ncbi:MAG: MarC family protein [Candidatus Omnitrophota bacterium]